MKKGRKNPRKKFLKKINRKKYLKKVKKKYRKKEGGGERERVIPQGSQQRMRQAHPGTGEA